MPHVNVGSFGHILQSKSRLLYISYRGLRGIYESSLNVKQMVHTMSNYKEATCFLKLLGAWFMLTWHHFKKFQVAIKAIP